MLKNAIKKCTGAAQEQRAGRFGQAMVHAALGAAAELSDKCCGCVRSPASSCCPLSSPKGGTKGQRGEGGGGGG